MAALADLVMPKLGLTMTEGTLVEWKVARGESVHPGDILFVVETEKVTNEIEASGDGVVEEILVSAGNTVPVGAVVARWTGTALGGAGPKAPAILQNEPSLPADRAHTDRHAVLGLSRIVATPLAKRLARERGINLRSLTGTGPRGRITARDVGSSTAESRTSVLNFPAKSRRRPATRYEATVATRLTAAARDVPHFYAATDADVGVVLELRKQLNASEGRIRVSINHILIAALARTMRDDPIANRVWRDGEIEEYDVIDIGIAVDADSGLVVPVLRDIGAVALDVVVDDATWLVDRAKRGQLGVADTQGGAITISNVGNHQISYLGPIINPGQSAILGVGAIRPVFRPGADGAPELRHELGLVLACDHRIWDGMAAAKFLERFVDCLKHPIELVRPIVKGR